jgi:hypothetical protein
LPANSDAITQSQSPLCDSANVDRRRCLFEKVWVRVGKYCDIGEWGFRSCALISGKEGEIGAVRTIGHSVIVGQTRYSYTYTQPLRATGLYPPLFCGCQHVAGCETCRRFATQVSM